MSFLLGGARLDVEEDGGRLGAASDEGVTLRDEGEVFEGYGALEVRRPIVRVGGGVSNGFEFRGGDVVEGTILVEIFLVAREGRGQGDGGVDAAEDEAEAEVRGGRVGELIEVG